MKYCIANFRREIPLGPELKRISAFDNYQIFEVSDALFENFGNFNVPYEEITEFEATVAVKFYGEVRPYRSAYSDVEGLEPDPESLAQGKRKTKVPFTEDIYNATVQLMKRIFRRNVIDIFDTREDRTGEEEILALIDSLTTIRDISYHRERLLGIEMSKTQLRELYLWDDELDSRRGRHQFIPGF